MTSQQERGPGKNKRKWTAKEDVMLVESLLEFHNSGMYQAENGFKPGVLKATENKLEQKLPGCGLKAKPHIESRIKTLKSKCAIVYDLMYGKNTSGFGWDPVRKCVTAENAVWDAYCEVHKDAEKLRDTPFPFYEELCIIFGKDRATGKYAESRADAVEELEREELNNVEDENANENEGGGSDDTRECRPKLTGRKRKSGNFDDFVEAIKDAYTHFGEVMKETSEKLSRAIGLDLTEKQMKLNGELTKISGLTRAERHRATLMIGAEDFKINIFFSLPDDEKEEWTRLLINNST